MARVLILTLSSAINVGAYLQAFALKQVIEEFGFEVKFAQFPNNAETLHNVAKVKKYYSDLPKLIFKFKSRIRYKQLQTIFQMVSINDAQKFDYIIIGSDEVWNINNSNFEHHLEYFGDGLGTRNIISYAPSANGVSIDDFRRKLPQIKFNNFKALSARDSETKKLVETISGRKVEIVVDPTLLVADFNGINEMCRGCKYTNFILVYSYGLDNKDIKKIIAFAKKHKMQTISVGTYNSWCDKNIIVTPFEFLDYLKMAKYVIVSTFHGTLLSIKYNKKFGVFAYKSFKICGALEQYELFDRELSMVNDIETVLQKDIDYKYINDLISANREFSRKFLLNSLDCTD